MSSRRIRTVVLVLSAFAATAAWAEGFRLEKRFELAAGGSLSLRAEAGDVVVRGGDGSAAVVTITSDRSDFEATYAVRFDDRKSGRLEVVIERKNRGIASWFGGFRGHTEVAVTLPRDASAQVEGSGGAVEVSNLVGAVSVKSSGGGVRLADIGGAAVLSSSGGSVVAERIGGALSAQSSGGGVEVRQIASTVRLASSGGSVEAEEIAGDLDASSSGGGVRIREAHGAVVAESSGGPVKVGFAAGNARGGRLESSGGGLTVTVDPSVGLEIDAVSSGGSVECDLPVTVRGKIRRDSLQGGLNGGGALLKLRTSGGGITIAGR